MEAACEGTEPIRVYWDKQLRTDRALRIKFILGLAVYGASLDLRDCFYQSCDDGLAEDFGTSHRCLLPSGRPIVLLSAG